MFSHQRRRHKNSSKIGKFYTISLLGIFAIGIITLPVFGFGFTRSYATTVIQVDSTTCIKSPFSGNWVPGPPGFASLRQLPPSSLNVPSGTEIIIPNLTSLEDGGAAITIERGGSIVVDLGGELLIGNRGASLTINEGGLLDNFGFVTSTTSAITNPGTIINECEAGLSSGTIVTGNVPVTIVCPATSTTTETLTVTQTATQTITNTQTQTQVSILTTTLPAVTSTVVSVSTQTSIQNIRPTLLIEARDSSGNPIVAQSITVTGPGASSPVVTDGSGNYLFAAGVLTEGDTYTASTVINGVSLSGTVILSGNSVILLEPTAPSMPAPEFPSGILAVVIPLLALGAFFVLIVRSNKAGSFQLKFAYPL